METFIISGLIVMAVTIVGIAAAIYVMSDQKKRNELSPIVSTTATLLSKDIYHKDDEKQYIIDLKLRTGKKRSFEVVKKVWLHLHEGDQGILTHKGSELIDFVVKKSLYHEHKSFFKNNIKTEPILYFYGEAKELGLNIFSDRKTEIDLQDVAYLIKEIKEDQTDWFFSLTTKDNRTLQIERFSPTEVKVSSWIKVRESFHIIPIDMLFKDIESFVGKS
jgi:hypothetical protein